MMLNRSPEASMQDIDKLSMICKCFFDSGRICIHGKELLRQVAFRHKYSERYVILKQMFDISES